MTPNELDQHQADLRQAVRARFNPPPEVTEEDLLRWTQTLAMGTHVEATDIGMQLIAEVRRLRREIDNLIEQSPLH